MFRLLPALALPWWSAPEVQVFKDVRYFSGAEADPKKHLLNLYLPRTQKTFPLAIFVHGGSWRRGDKDDRAGAYELLGKNLARDGIGVAVINYRLSPQVRHPEHAQDVARAVAWAAGQAGRYGWGATRIFLLGHSAGAHLSSLVAVDPSYLARAGVQNSIIAGVVAISGVYDLTITGVTGRMLYQGVFPVATAGLRSASPSLQIQTSPSPFLLLYAQQDYMTADLQARRFKKALEGKGGRAQVRAIAGLNHISVLRVLIEPERGDRQTVIDFIRHHFGQQGKVAGLPSGIPVQ